MSQTEPAIHLTLPNEPGATTDLRRALDALGRQCGLTSDEQFALNLAGTEALTNALEGAPRGEHVDVRLSGCEGSVQVEVRGPGQFRPSAVANVERGRGIPLMLAVADEVDFASTPDGTRVRVRKRLGEPRGASPLF
jgi:anti-sigma regulatory factor (Ser/Thr protein kinase)